MRTKTALKPQDRAPMRWITLTAGPRILTDASKGVHFRVLLTENATLEPPLNGTAGQKITYRIEQPASGKTVTIHANWRQRGTVTVSSTASSVTYLDAFYDEEASAWDLIESTVGAIATHEAASDPHPTYLTQAEAALLYGAIRIPISSEAADFNISALAAYVMDTAAGVVTGTLPASPTDGDWVLLNRSGANNAIAARNGKLIDGSAADFTLTPTGFAVRLIYDSGSGSWWTF